jgi:DNA/RNA endonuclease YhcR with UshA esterase domain
MKIVAVLFFCLVTLYSSAQKEIKLAEVKDHIGDTIEVRGNVYGVRYLAKAKNTPTFISLGAAYPDQLLTIVIWGDVRKQLPYKPEEVINGHGEITVFGRVEEYKGKLQVTIRNADQLVFKYDEEVPFDQIPPIEKKKGQ